MLQLTHFEKVYPNHVVLRVERFTIPPGVYWVRGANGSGKTTLLKALAGLTGFGGEVLLDQRLTLQRQPVAYRAAVNFAEAEPVFPDFLTGYELIQLFMAAKQAPPHQQSEYLETMQMSPWVGQPLSTYSSGMLKKLSLVLAFLGQPRCILLDEPLTTLDAESLPVLAEWIRRQGPAVTVLLASHQPVEDAWLPTVRSILVEQATIRYMA